MVVVMLCALLSRLAPREKNTVAFDRFGRELMEGINRYNLGVSVVIEFQVERRKNLTGSGCT
jgi:hypothetical protein